MLETILITASVLIALLLASIKKVYARTGQNQDFPDRTSPKSKRALNYIADRKDGMNFMLGGLMLFFASVAAAAFGISTGWLGILAVYLLLTVIILLLPETNSSGLSKRLAFLVAPYVRAVLEKIQPWTKKAAPLVRRLRPDQTDSGVYTRDDLTKFLDRQKHSANNLISGEELDSLVARLEFEQKNVKDAMRPKNKLKIIGASEQVGPVLINELHETGQKYFPVEEEFNNEFIGTLDVTRLVSLKHTGNAKEAMEDRLYYLNENYSLPEAVDAFFKTGSSIFLVVNNKEKITGMLNVEEIIAGLLNQDQLNDFDMFDSREAMARGEQRDEEDE
jgi:CBS domain containing-hemolysin-like protein